MEFIYIAYFVSSCDDEIPHAFFTKEEVEAFCLKKNQEFVDRWNKKYGLANMPETCLTLEELFDGGDDYWTYKKIKIGE